MQNLLSFDETKYQINIDTARDTLTASLSLSFLREGRTV